MKTPKMSPHKSPKRKSRRAPSKWNMFVKKIFNEMKREDPSTTFKDAMQEASARKNEM
jgi:hypothetical protein